MKLQELTARFESMEGSMDQSSPQPTDPALVEQHSCQPECEASPERQSASQEVDPGMLAQIAIPPLPMTGSPRPCLDSFDLLQWPVANEVDDLYPEIETLNLMPPMAHDEKAIQIDTTIEEKQMIIDLLRQVNELSQRPTANGTDVLHAEIDTLKCKLSTANEEKTIMLAAANDLAIQIKKITEEKQKILDDLQRQVNELSQRPDVDGIDKLRTEIDMLQLMLLKACDEKAIQIESITEEKQMISDKLQRQVNELSQRVAETDTHMLAFACVPPSRPTAGWDGASEFAEPDNTVDPQDDLWRYRFAACIQALSHCDTHKPPHFVLRCAGAAHQIAPLDAPSWSEEVISRQTSKGLDDVRSCDRNVPNEERGTQVETVAEDKHLSDVFEAHAATATGDDIFTTGHDNNALTEQHDQAACCSSTPGSLPEVHVMPVSTTSFYKMKRYSFIRAPRGEPSSVNLIKVSQRDPLAGDWRIDDASMIRITQAETVFYWACALCSVLFYLLIRHQ